MIGLLFVLSTTCSLLVKGGHRVMFDGEVDYVRMDGEPVKLDSLGGFEITTVGGEYRIEYRFHNGKAKELLLYPSISDDSPALVVHRGYIEGSIKYKAVR